MRCGQAVVGSAGHQGPPVRAPAGAVAVASRPSACPQPAGCAGDRCTAFEAARSGRTAVRPGFRAAHRAAGASRPLRASIPCAENREMRPCCASRAPDGAFGGPRGPVFLESGGTALQSGKAHRLAQSEPVAQLPAAPEWKRLRAQTADVSEVGPWPTTWSTLLPIEPSMFPVKRRAIGRKFDGRRVTRKGKASLRRAVSTAAAQLMNGGALTHCKCRSMPAFTKFPRTSRITGEAP